MLHNGFSTLNVMYASCRHNVKRQFIVYFGGCWWVVAYLFFGEKERGKEERTHSGISKYRKGKI